MGLLLGVGLLDSIARRFDEAEEAHRRALWLHPGSELARLMLWDSLERQGRWREAAVVVCGEMVERDPSYENAYYHQAWCYLETGCLAEAVSDCRRAIEIYLLPTRGK